MTASFRGVVGVQILVESCYCLFFTRVQVCDENGELITTETRDDVRATETAIKNGGGLDECVVAFVMSKLVVDSLHAIKVDEEKQQLFFLTASEVSSGRVPPLSFKPIASPRHDPSRHTAGMICSFRRLSSSSK